MSSPPIVVISMVATPKPTSAPTRACNAVAPVPSALDRSTASAPSTTQNECSSDASFATSTANASPSPARAALRKRTERTSQCARSIVHARASVVAAPPLPPTVSCAASGAFSAIWATAIDSRRSGNAAVNRSTTAAPVVGVERRHGPGFERSRCDGRARVVERVEVDGCPGTPATTPALAASVSPARVTRARYSGRVSASGDRSATVTASSSGTSRCTATTSSTSARSR